MPVRYQHLQAKTENMEEYIMDNSRVLANTICHANYTFIQTYSLKAGIKKFGEQGGKAALDEMKQIHDRVVFRPIRIENMSETERKHAMESLMFLVQKKFGCIKARTCANSSTQRQYITKDEATSLTVSHEATIITGVIEAKQQHDIMTADIPNAFVQTDINQSDEKIIMKIRGELVDILVDVSQEIYSNYVVQEKGQCVFYVQMLKALYGMMVSSLLYYKKFRKDMKVLDLKLIHMTCVWPIKSSMVNSIHLHGMWMMSSLAMKIAR